MGQSINKSWHLRTRIWHPLQISLQGKMTSQRRENLESRSSNTLPNLLLIVVTVLFTCWLKHSGYYLEYIKKKSLCTYDEPKTK